MWPTYYTTDTGGFGMFSVHGTPKKTYHAFRAFRRLLETPLRVAATGDQPDHMAIGAGIGRDRSAVGILISHDRNADEPIRLTIDHRPWSGSTKIEVFTLDATHNLDRTRAVQQDAPEPVILDGANALSVWLVTLKPDR